MDLWELRVGMQVRLATGAIGKVVSSTEDGQWIRVRYLQSALSPALVNTEDLCSADEVVAILAE